MSEPTKTSASTRLCRCGCGEPSTREFLQGHDQIAIHARIRKIGSVGEFLDWFDTHFDDPDIPGAPGMM